MKDFIDVLDRLPKREDADANGCVLAWHKYNGWMITNYTNVMRDVQSGGECYFQFWIPMPERPDRTRGGAFV